MITLSAAGTEPATEPAAPQGALERLKQFLPQAGVDLSPPKSAFFNERLGMLLIHATTNELALIERILEVLQVNPPQLTIEVKWCERRVDDPWPEGLAPNNGDTNSPFKGILTDAQFRKVISSLKEQAGVDLLATPKVTTISGRHAQIRAVDERYIVDLRPSTNDAGILLPVIEPYELGPVLDVIPHVGTDWITVTLNVIGTVKEFVGYDMDAAQELLRKADLGPAAPRKSLVESALDGQEPGASRRTSSAVQTSIPLPVLRLRQIQATAAVVDGQTLVLVGGLSESEVLHKDKVPILGDLPLAGRLFRSERRETVKKQLMLFVTPTLIDPAGNRIHTEEQLAEKISRSVPAQ